jgi:hypothetical protein
MGPEGRQHEIGDQGICDDHDQREQQEALQSRMIGGCWRLQISLKVSHCGALSQIHL